MADKNKDAATGDAMKPFWPDVCNTTYVATGDADELVKMRDELEDCMKSGGLLWLLDELRLDDTRVDCRGHVSCVAGLDACGRLRWVVRSAWEPCRDLFDAFAARHPGAAVLWFAREGDGGPCWTNDAEGALFPERWHVALNDGDEEFDMMFLTLEEALAEMNGRLGLDCRTPGDVREADRGLRRAPCDVMMYVRLDEVHVVE